MATQLSPVGTPMAARAASEPSQTVTIASMLALLTAEVENGCGNGALKKIGAVQEGILRKSFLRGGKYLDQALWAILDQDWYRSKAVWGAKAN